MFVCLFVWAVQFIACDCHAHLVSKAGSVISRTSASPAFRWSRNSLTSLALSQAIHLTNHGTGFTDEIRMTIACDYLHSP